MSIAANYTRYDLFIINPVNSLKKKFWTLQLFKKWLHAFFHSLNLKSAQKQQLEIALKMYLNNLLKLECNRKIIKTVDENVDR